MGWVVTKSLARLMADFRSTFPAKDRTSDGTIGDLAHQAETSGHNPDDTAGSRSEYTDADSIPEVRAIDVDNDLNAGITMQQVIDRMLQTPGDLKRLKYIIYNRRIWSRNTNWQPRVYTGSSPHTEHAHFSGDPAFDDDASPWTSVISFSQEGGLMANASEIIEAWSGGFTTTSDGKGVAPVVWRIRDEAWQKNVNTTLGALAQQVAAKQDVALTADDRAALAAQVVEQLAPLLPTLSDIEGIVDAKVKAALNATRLNVT